ncbi:unnamed protein product [Mytilus coruscus]|uniref:Uncharacterized protein n=1 Tax=Mytilus coruscus TaxID=42192 RepID=A0A6J8DBN2_MYTCO|nr:unnamed protein product [Mytilus coruscus]
MGLVRAVTMVYVLFLLIINCRGFLLDTGKGQTSSSGQFLSESEFLEAKKLLNQEINDLRRDTDKTIALLTTQLKNKFDILEQKVANVDNNGTNQNNMPTKEYLVLEQKLNEVLNDNADLKREIKIMKNEMAAMRNALSALNNASSEHSRKIEDLQHLGSIKRLHEISSLQQSVKSNSDSIQFLSMHEQARRQDFLALYNMTTDSNRRLSEL